LRTPKTLDYSPRLVKESVRFLYFLKGKINMFFIIIAGNLIDCYILNFLFVGVLGILICVPSVVILNFICCFILALTSFAWIPVVLLFHYFLSVFFYDFDNK
jgi:hypothetical protein